MRLSAQVEHGTTLGAKQWHGLGVTAPPAALGTQPWHGSIHLEQHIWMWWALSQLTGKQGADKTLLEVTHRVFLVWLPKPQLASYRSA